MTSSKTFSVAILVIAEMAAMSVWFASTAVLPDMMREAALGPTRQALLTSAVQAGFVLGAVVVSVSGVADRLDPRWVIAVSAIAASTVNAAVIALPIGGVEAIAARFTAGALLAGVYPVGMKIAAGWGARDRGFLVGLLVGALTVGSAAPYLLAFFGSAQWRSVVVGTSLFGGAGGLTVLATALGPYHARAPRFEPRAILLAWTNPRIRQAYLGYFGHMWELYAMWAWVGAFAAASYAARLDVADAEALAKLTAFMTIALGGATCVLAGAVADRFGKAEVAIAAMTGSALAALLTAASFGGPVWLTFALVLVWGMTIVPDSAQFSALVADAAPPHLTGSLLTFQTALGFTLTIGTVQAAPVIAAYLGWPALVAILAIGPILGIIAMLPLCRSGPRST